VVAHIAVILGLVGRPEGDSHVQRFPARRGVVALAASLALIFSAAPGLLPAGSLELCSALAPPTGATVAVSTESGIREQAFNAAAGTTIIISSGTYFMSDYVHISNDGVTLRGQTGHRTDVILDFGGMTTGHEGIHVYGDDVTIADLTIRNSAICGVSIQGVDRPVLYNLHIIDINDQLVKVR